MDGAKGQEETLLAWPATTARLRENVRTRTPHASRHGHAVLVRACVKPQRTGIITCSSADLLVLPGVLDLEAAGGAELVGLAGLRHGAERRAAQVEVHGLLQARAAGALVGEDHRHRAAGARREIGRASCRERVSIDV